MAGSKDLISSVRTLIAAEALATGAAATSTSPIIIDTLGFESHMLAAVITASAADGDVTLEITHGDDSGLSDGAIAPARDVLPQGTEIPDYTDATPGQVVVPAVTANSVIGKIGYVGPKRYISLTVTTVGTTTTVTESICVSGDANETPVA